MSAIPFCVPGRCESLGCDAVVCQGAALTNSELFARASRVIPGGVNSPVRAFKAVGGTPYFVARADGARVWDAEGNEYIDFVQSYGAIILGHAHKRVVEAVGRAAVDGTSYGAPTPREMKLAEEICRRMPSIEQVRLVSSGTEATMTAIRVARGFTGRDKVLKFAGCYHGHEDGLLAAGGSGVVTLGLSGSAGVTEAAVSQTLVAPYNVVPTIGDDVACVIVEPVAANMGLVPPAPGFLEGLRRACDAAGALLVFDEVITGFRLGVGGFQETSPVRPDLTCLGKVVGGGLPIGAFGGRADVMASLAPLGPVYQAGTLSGNPLATAAGLAALDELDADVYAVLRDRAARFGAALGAAVAASGLAVQVPVVGTLVGVRFASSPAGDEETAKQCDVGLHAQFFHALLRRGVALAPGAFEVAFPGVAHGDDVLDEVVNKAGEAAEEIAASARAS